MKALVILITVFTVLFTTNSFADDDKSKKAVKKTEAVKKAEATQSNIAKWKNGMVVVTLEKPINESVFVNVYDKNNDLVSVKRVKKEPAARIQYDLANAPKGEYTVKVIKNGKTINEQKFSK